MEVKDVFTIVFSASALVVSIVAFVWTRYYNRATLRAAHRSSYMNALLNLNREIVAHPELWSVYEEQWQPGAHATETARRRAFIWYHFNLFELFYTDYHQQRNDAPDSDTRQYWDAWDEYIRTFLEGSAEARAIVGNPKSMALLHRDFRTYLTGCLPKANGST
jgi:hypothetical protein